MFLENNLSISPCIVMYRYREIYHKVRYQKRKGQIDVGGYDPNLKQYVSNTL